MAGTKADRPRNVGRRDVDRENAVLLKEVHAVRRTEKAVGAGIGGALIGNAFGGPAGAVLGGVAGAVLGGLHPIYKGLARRRA